MRVKFILSATEWHGVCKAIKEKTDPCTHIDCSGYGCYGCPFNDTLKRQFEGQNSKTIINALRTLVEVESDIEHKGA